MKQLFLRQLAIIGPLFFAANVTPSNAATFAVINRSEGGSQAWHQLAISLGDKSRIFKITGETVPLSGLTVKDGRRGRSNGANGAAGNGATKQHNSTKSWPTDENPVVTGNVASEGAILSARNRRLSRVTLSHNQCWKIMEAQILKRGLVLTMTVAQRSPLQKQPSSIIRYS